MYTYSPATLRSCFGFPDDLQFWHPGDDLNVARIVNSRNNRLIALESPKTKNGVVLCADIHSSAHDNPLEDLWRVVHGKYHRTRSSARCPITPKQHAKRHKALARLFAVATISAAAKSLDTALAVLA